MTTATSQPVALAFDALDSVVLWPEHAPAWWHLASCIAGLSGESRLQVLAAVRATRLESPHARWFQESALHDATGDPMCLARQAALAADLPGMERWLSFANVAWWSALSGAPDRPAFRRLLLETRLPDVLEMLGNAIPACCTPLAPRSGVERVAIVAQHLSTGHHAPTALAFDVRAVLERAGVDTRVFGAQEIDVPAMRGYTAAAQVSTVAPVDAASWQLRMPGEVSVVLADVRYSLQRRWEALCRMVDEYDPDAILFVGFYSPLLWPLRRRYPLLGMSLHTLPPIAPVDAWLAADGQAVAGQTWPGLPSPAAVHFPFRFWPVAATPVPRDELAIRADALLLVTAGTRIDEIEPLASWFDSVVSVIEEHPGVEWLVIGQEPAAAAATAARHPRIHVLPARRDLAACIAAADLFLNPPRMGGGATVAMAMQRGVPVVSMADSDGGDKIAPQAVDSAQAYRARLHHWITDPAARREEGKRLQAKFREELDISGPTAAARLVDACRLAQRTYRERRAAAAAAEAAS